jgi:phage shock protein B
MISQLLTSGLVLASDVDDSEASGFFGLGHGFLAFAAVTVIMLCIFAPRILRELRKWRRPEGLRKEDLATLKRISAMLDKMESRVDALEIILSDSNAQKNNQPGKTQAYGNQR